MSRVDELIAELCPDSVEFTQLGNLASYVRGVTYSKHDEQSDGPIHVLRSNNITLATNRINFDDVRRVAGSVRVRDDQWLRANDILISAASGSKAHVGKVAFITDDIDYCFGGFMAVLRTRSSIESRFLFHLLIGRAFNDYLGTSVATTTINNLSAAIMNAYRVPVPPLEVQREIVRILDTFSALEAELEAELEARRRQYEHYRRQIVRGIRAERVCLHDLGRWFGGITPSKAEPRYWDGGHIPWLASMDVSDSATPGIRGRVTPAALDETSLRLIPPPSVAVVMRSNILRRRLPIGLITEETTVNQDIRALVPRDGVDAEFVYQVLSAQSEELRARCVRTDGSMAAVDSKSFFAVEVSLPSLEEQRHLAGKLRKFDTLVNDLSIGLPAELAARRTQYEHYRDRLLTFPEAA